MKSFVIVTLIVLSGCSGMQRGMGFDDVSQEVQQRTNMRVIWNSGTPEDEQATQAVHDLLQEGLTADSAVQIALLNNRELQALYEDLHIAQADLVQAGLLRNPIFDAQIRFATSGSGTGVDLGVAQDFVSLLYLSLRKGRAAAAFEAAKLRVTGAVLDFASEARAGLYELQAAEQLLEMRRSVVEATAASYDLAQRLREAGNNRDLDVANERALHEESKVQLAVAEANVIARRERMNEIMGLWGVDTSWRTASRLPTIPEQEIVADGLERRAVESSLDLGLARREIEVAARQLGIAKPLGWLDDAEVGVAAEREVEGGWSAGPAFVLPIPLFDQGQAVVGSAQARYRQVSERYIATAVRLRSRVRAAYSATLEARDRAAHYERVLLPLRQTIVDETQLQYNAMQVGAFQLLQAKRDQIETGARYIQSLRDYWLSRTALEQILSGRMGQIPMHEMPDVPSPSETGSRDGGTNDH
jgi:outer membrane protein, heavy metal efflux system